MASVRAAPKERAAVVLTRLNDVDGWELYRAAARATDALVCTIALRPDAAAAGVDYGVWRGEDGEPSATGVIDWASIEGALTDADRDGVLREILAAYHAALPELRGGVELRLGEPDEDADDDDYEDDD